MLDSKSLLCLLALALGACSTFSPATTADFYANGSFCGQPLEILNVFENGDGTKDVFSQYPKLTDPELERAVSAGEIRAFQRGEHWVRIEGLQGGDFEAVTYFDGMSQLLVEPRWTDGEQGTDSRLKRLGLRSLGSPIAVGEPGVLFSCFCTEDAYRAGMTTSRDREYYAVLRGNKATRKCELVGLLRTSSRMLHDPFSGFRVSVPQVLGEAPSAERIGRARTTARLARPHFVPEFEQAIANIDAIDAAAFGWLAVLEERMKDSPIDVRLRLARDRLSQLSEAATVGGPLEERAVSLLRQLSQDALSFASESSNSTPVLRTCADLAREELLDRDGERTWYRAEYLRDLERNKFVSKYLDKISSVIALMAHWKQLDVTGRVAFARTEGIARWGAEDADCPAIMREFVAQFPGYSFQALARDELVAGLRSLAERAEQDGRWLAAAGHWLSIVNRIDDRSGGQPTLEECRRELAKQRDSGRLEETPVWRARRILLRDDVLRHMVFLVGGHGNGVQTDTQNSLPSGLSAARVRLPLDDIETANRLANETGAKLVVITVGSSTDSLVENVRQLEAEHSYVESETSAAAPAYQQAIRVAAEKRAGLAARIQELDKEIESYNLGTLPTGLSSWYEQVPSISSYERMQGVVAPARIEVVQRRAEGFDPFVNRRWELTQKRNGLVDEFHAVQDPTEGRPQVSSHRRTIKHGLWVQEWSGDVGRPVGIRVGDRVFETYQSAKYESGLRTRVLADPNHQLTGRDEFLTKEQVVSSVKGMLDVWLFRHVRAALRSHGFDPELAARRCVEQIHGPGVDPTSELYRRELEWAKYFMWDPSCPPLQLPADSEVQIMLELGR